MTWPTATLGDVTTSIRNGLFARRPSEHPPGVQILRISAVRRGKLELADSKYVEGLTEEQIDKFSLDPGDLLMTRYNGSRDLVGTAALVPPHGTTIIHPDKLIRIVVDPKVADPRFINYQLQSTAVRAFLEPRIRTTAGQSGIAGADVHAIPITLPSLAAQRVVVNVLEGHLARLDAGTALLSRAKSAASAMVRSVLTTGLRGELVDDDLTEGTGADLVGIHPDFIASGDDRVWPLPKNWMWMRLGDVFEVNIGATPSRSSLELWTGNLPWVSSGEVSFGRISSTRERITRPAAGNTRTRIHPPGTVMLAMIGEGRTRGQAAILDIEAAHNQNCASIRVSTTKILPEYIFGYLEERYRETRRGGSGGQQPALNKAAIQRFPVPIAPLGTQRRLAEAWASARDLATRLNYELNLANTRSGSLRRSLLKAAFSGQLSSGDVRVFKDVVA